MKKLLIIICALFLSGAAFAALDRDYFDYSQSEEFQSIPTDTSVNTTGSYNSNYSNGTTQETIVTTKRVKKVVENNGKKRIRFGNEASGWINTYWNFGQPVYGETGRF